MLLKGSFCIRDRKEQHSAQGDELVVLLPFSCERSSLPNKPSAIISTQLWIVGWVWGFSICNGWFMKDKMCHLSKTCSDYNMMSLTIGAQKQWSGLRQDYITPKFGKFGHFKRLTVIPSVSKESMCSSCFSVSFNILLFALLLIYVVEPWLLPYCLFISSILFI